MIIKKSPDEMQSYLTDAANIKGSCDAVYIPSNEEEIIQIILEANHNITPVTVAGNHTGLTGGAVPDGGIVVSLEKFNRIHSFNQEDKTVVVEAGVILKDLKNYLKDKNFLYPPDPTEENCFIGGTIATNASGAKTFKYGPTRNFVKSINVILPTGKKIFLERGKQKANISELNLITDDGEKIIIPIPDYKMPAVKNASGYYCKRNMDAIDLFIGSEGTLGIITKAELNVLALPESLISCVVFFINEKDALSFIQTARNFSYQTRKEKKRNSIDARALEYFDENSLNFLREDFPKIPQGAKTAVWFEQETETSEEETILNHWVELLNRCSYNENNVWFGTDDKDREEIRKFRHALAWKVSEYLTQNNFKKLGTDVAVPDNKFEELFYYSKEIVSAAGIFSLAYGHFGNSHLHLNMLPKNDDEYLKGKELYRQICEKTVLLEGTISAEHGIGKLKREYLLMMYGEKTVAQMKKIKEIIDPNNILGRGNLFL